MAIADPVARRAELLSASTSWNLRLLLQRRYAFIQKHVRAGDRVLEIGSGLGLLPEFIGGTECIMTDIEPFPWIDAVASAETLPFPSDSFDAVVAIAVLHHHPYPLRALREISRVTKFGGRLFLLEAHVSVALRGTLALANHEYVDWAVDPYGPRTCLPRRANRLDGNNAVGDLLFGNQDKFATCFPELCRRHHRFRECFSFLNSGGISSRFPSVPLPRRVIEAMIDLDELLCNRWPNLFAFIQELVFEKRRPSRAGAAAAGGDSEHQ